MSQNDQIPEPTSKYWERSKFLVLNLVAQNYKREMDPELLYCYDPRMK